MAPSPTLTPSPLPTPTTFAPPDSLAPGDWTAIHWTKVKVPEQAGLWEPAPTPEASSDTYVADTHWTVYGWSRGYVAFDTVTTTTYDGDWIQVTRTQNSADGLSWQSGETMQDSGSGDSGHDNGVVGVAEGPAGLLAYTSAGVTCSNLKREWPIAISRDGIKWRPIPSSDATNNRVLDAGSSGYITTAPDGASTSTDGLTWKAVDLKVNTDSLGGIEIGRAHV